MGIKYASQNVRYSYTADFGGVANFAYSFGRNKITLKNLYDQTLNNLFIYRPQIRITAIDNTTFRSDQAYTGLSHIIEQKKIFNSILSGELRAGENNETRLDWNVNATLNNTVTPDTRTFILYEVDSTKGLYNSSSDISFSNSLAYFSRSWYSNKDFIYGGAFNLTTPFKLFNNKHLFKSGNLERGLQPEQ